MIVWGAARCRPGRERRSPTSRPPPRLALFQVGARLAADSREREGHRPQARLFRRRARLLSSLGRSAVGRAEGPRAVDLRSMGRLTRDTPPPCPQGNDQLDVGRSGPPEEQDERELDAVPFIKSETTADLRRARSRQNPARRSRCSTRLDGCESGYVRADGRPGWRWRRSASPAAATLVRPLGL